MAAPAANHDTAGIEFFGHACRAGHTAEQHEEHFHYDFSGAFPSPPKFDDKYAERDYLKGRLALAYRLFAKLGFEEGVSGHISLRDPVDPETFWMNSFGTSFALMKRSDLIRVDHSGKVLDGGKNRLVNRAGVMIHSSIHEARPDVICAAHAHSTYGRAFSALRRPLKMLTQDHCAFYEDCNVYTIFPGISNDKDEGQHIASALGSKKAAILANHGILAGSATIEATIFWYLSLERCCYTQLIAEAALAGLPGEHLYECDAAAAAESYQTVGLPTSGWFSGKPLFDALEVECGEEYLK